MTLFSIALGCALLFYHFLVSNTAETVQILVLTSTKQSGERLTSDDVVWRAWPAMHDQKSYVHQESEKQALLNKMVNGVLIAGEPLAPEKVIDPQDLSRLASRINPRHRALTMAVDKQMLPTGLIRPGDVVDVIWTHKIKHNMTERYESTPLAEKIQVIAVDQALEGHALVGKTPETMTISVLPELAQKILIAKETGKLTYLVRGASCNQDDTLCTLSEDQLQKTHSKWVTFTEGAKREQREIK